MHLVAGTDRQSLRAMQPVRVVISVNSQTMMTLDCRVNFGTTTPARGMLPQRTLEFAENEGIIHGTSSQEGGEVNVLGDESR